MKKINNRGFILAETLIVAVFLMVIFAMIYANFYPMIGEYEKRENYDDVDGKYTAYWIKKMIESEDYQFRADDYRMLNRLGYTRFECDHMKTEESKMLCRNLVNSLEISRCDYGGLGCDIYITRFKIDSDEPDDYATDPPSLKAAVRGTQTGQGGVEITNLNESAVRGGANPYGSSANLDKLKEQMRGCCNAEAIGRRLGDTISCDVPDLTAAQHDYGNESANYRSFYTDSEDGVKNSIAMYCQKRLRRESFLSPTKDYILSLPNFKICHAATQARFRVIVVVHHTKDGNDYYSFSNMEVVR